MQRKSRSLNYREAKMIISIASGKGGTGKTTVSTNLALSLGSGVRLLDCDVEQPNAHLFIPLSKTWSSGPGQRYLALPWDKSNSGVRCQVSGVSKSKS